MTNHAPLTIREAEPHDAEALVRLMNPIKAFPARGVFLVAIRLADNRLVGFQSMEPFATYARAFDHVGVLGTYVALDCRRQGIASQLFEATFAAAARKSYEKIFTFVRADNPAALETYLRHGFRVIGTAQRHARIAGKDIDEVIIEKLLADGPRPEPLD